MNWIFPVAGRGTRLQTYGRFKPFVAVLGRPIAWWCLQGLRPLIGPADRFAFVTTEAFERDFAVSAALARLFRDLDLANRPVVMLAPDTPPGPAASVLIGAGALPPDEPCTVVNIDQMVQFVPPAVGPDEGFLPVYFNDTGKSSYARIADGLVREVREKEMCSFHASAGVYGVGRLSALVAAIEALMASGERHKDEFYVGPALNHAIRAGMRIRPVAAIAKYDLGDVESVRAFEASFTAFAGGR